jgi:Protein of unknown function (DUF4254)
MEIKDFCQTAWAIFNQSIADYHVADDVNTPINNPFSGNSIEQLLYQKNWIDTVQWHYEDIIRDEQIDPVAALALKRQIDASNQHRTDLVEYIDAWFLQQCQSVVPTENARINTESPAWAIDRYSILSLKFYHMQQEVDRPDASPEHKAKCSEKLNVLLAQHQDLSMAIQALISDVYAGKVVMKVYKQMKMYNDESLNPVLYNKK